MQIEAIKVRRLYLQVAQQLRERISAGEFPPGQRLPSERDLAAGLGVSRPTIREAIIALEIAGLVEVRSGSGVYVVSRSGSLREVGDSSSPGPFEILEARMLIEAETCALAATRIDAAQLEYLQRLVDDMAEENRQEAVSEEADERFHCAIAEAAGNSALTASIAWLWRLRNASPISVYYQRRVRREGIRPIIADHQAIVDALAARDPERSRAAMRNHLQRVIEQLLEAV